MLEKVSAPEGFLHRDGFGDSEDRPSPGTVSILRQPGDGIGSSKHREIWLVSVGKRALRECEGKIGGSQGSGRSPSSNLLLSRLGGGCRERCWYVGRSGVTGCMCWVGHFPHSSSCPQLQPSCLEHTRVTGLGYTRTWCC